MVRSLWLCIVPAAALVALPGFGQEEEAAARPLYPLSAVVDEQGAIFVADRKLPGVWKILDGTPAVFFQADKKFRTPLNAVRCLALDHQGKLLAGDSATTTVYRFDDAGQPQPAHTGRVGIPSAIAVNQAGDIFVADLEPGRHAIRKIPAGGGEAIEFAKVGAPRGLTIDGEGRLYVVQHVGDLLIRLDAEGKSETLVQGQPLKSPAFPAGIAVADDGTAYLADGYNHAIWKVPPGGAPQVLVEGKPLVHPVSLAWRGANLLVVDPRAETPLIEVTPEGKATPLSLK